MGGLAACSINESKAAAASPHSASKPIQPLHYTPYNNDLQRYSTKHLALAKQESSTLSRVESCQPSATQNVAQGVSVHPRMPLGDARVVAWPGHDSIPVLPSVPNDTGFSSGSVSCCAHSQLKSPGHAAESESISWGGAATPSLSISPHDSPIQKLLSNVGMHAAPPDAMSLGDPYLQ